MSARSDSEVGVRAKPAMDTVRHARLETATFALG